MGVPPSILMLCLRSCAHADAVLTASSRLYVWESSDGVIKDISGTRDIEAEGRIMELAAHCLGQH